MSRLRAGLASCALVTLVLGSGPSATALAVSSPVPSPSPGKTSPAEVSPAKVSPGKAQRVAAEQSGAVSAARALGLGSGEALVVKDVVSDPDGSTHVRYNRTYDGLRVVGGDLVSHRVRSGKIAGVSWNGAHRVAVASTRPTVGAAAAGAVGTAKASLADESSISSRGELVVYSGGAKTTAKAKANAKAVPRLAYDVLTLGVRPDQTPSRRHTIVDATTGATLSSWDEIENATGTGNGIYVGVVPLDTTAVAGGYSLRDAVGNYTTNLRRAVDSTGTNTGTTFNDPDNSWGNGAVTDAVSAAVDAHYGAGKTFDFFKNVLGRNGIWDTGVGARSRVHYGNGYLNAFWDGTQMTYGDGASNTHPLVELDVAGHEMSHGVTENTAGLVGTGEAGGLNEATSDIFGTSVEFYANNTADNPDYLIGELVNINGDGTPLRYMDRPSRDFVSVASPSSPDCWSSTVGDLDPHYASGPLNHWFYLASEGSGPKTLNGVSYNSPTCNSSTVTPIGRDAAAKIWYRTLTTYLTSSDSYAAARDGAIQSAKDLYPADPSVCAGIASSFSAIGVPPGVATCGVTPPAAAGSNLLRNPGFESGNTLWSATSGVIAQWGSTTPSQPAHSGTWSAWLGGYGYVHNDSISQLVTIPAGSSATLAYYAHIASQESPTQAFDTMTVRAGSRALQTLSNLNAANGYQLRTVDLSAYSGRTISLSFSGSEDESAATSFVLDDIALTAWNCTPGTVILSPLDFTGDARSDVLRVTQTGNLNLYRGNGLGGLSGPGTSIGTGWRGFPTLFSPGDFTGDRRSDLLGVSTTGYLYRFAGNGVGRFTGSGVRIGSGWGGFTKIFSPGDFTGDGRSDVLAVTRGGDLYLYRGNGVGSFAGAGVRIGNGWGGFVSLLSPRDFTGDGRSDVLGVTSRGEMFLYRGNGLGRFTGSGVRIGTGWSSFVKIFSPGDFTGDGRSDVLGVRSNGFTYVYRGKGTGVFTGSGTKITPGLN